MHRQPQQPQQPQPHDAERPAQQPSPTAARRSRASLPPSNLGPTDNAYQLLRLEALTQSDTRRLLGVLDVAIRLSVVCLLVYLMLRWVPVGSSSGLALDDAFFICTTAFSDVNLALAAALLAAVGATGGWSCYRLTESLLSGKRWTQRRRRLFGLYSAQLASAALGMCAFLASNALVASSLTCSAAATRRAIYWLAWLRWSCWNCTFLVTTIKAHATTIVPPSTAGASRRQLLLLALELPLQLLQGKQARHGAQQQAAPASPATGPAGADPGELGSCSGASAAEQRKQAGPAGAGHTQLPQGHAPPPCAEAGPPKPPHQAHPDLMVLDLPWLYHWPKGVIWLVFEGCHTALAVLESLPSSQGGVCRALSDACDLQSCWPQPTVVGLLSAEVGLALLYYAVWVWLMLRNGRLLRSRPWQAYRIANVMFRLERRLGIWAYSLIVVASVLFWFGGLGDCSRAAFQYHGLPTTELMWATISIIGLLMMQPHNPREANPQLVVQLQDFAWTEEQLPAQLAARNAGTACQLSREPMFCFETAAKAFFWSCLVYEDYDGVSPEPLRCVRWLRALAA